MRSSQRLVFTCERRGCDLRDHKSGVQSGRIRQKCGKQAGMRIGHVLGAPLGNSAKSGQGNSELIRRHSQWLSVEISAADYVPSSGGAIGATKTSGLSVALLSSISAR